jgi:predicted kinase
MDNLFKQFEPTGEQMHGIDLEQELADLLQQEIWAEITAETGKTQQDLDNEIIMKLKDLNRQIVIVCGKLCSGKGHYCASIYPDYHQVTVSSVVKSLANVKTRSEMGQTQHLDQQIADALIGEINKHNKVIVDGIRQPSIIHRLQQEYGSQIKDIIWLDVPEETLRTRFNRRAATKDDMDFDRALDSDVKLGLNDTEQHIRKVGRVVQHADQT